MDKQDRSVKDDKPVKPEAQEKQEKPDKLDEKESVEQKDAPTSSESHPVTKIMAAEQWRDPWMRTQPLIPKAKSPEVTSPHLSHSSYSSSDTSDTDDTGEDRTYNLVPRAILSFSCGTQLPVMTDRGVPRHKRHYGAGIEVAGPMDE